MLIKCDNGYCGSAQTMTAGKLFLNNDFNTHRNTWNELKTKTNTNNIEFRNNCAKKKHYHEQNRNSSELKKYFFLFF